jgi:CheY-like chemotaxis protein
LTRINLCSVGGAISLTGARRYKIVFDMPHQRRMMERGNRVPFHEIFSMIKVAIADARGVVREGVRATLQSAGDFQIVGEAIDGPSTLVLAKTTDATLLTLGLAMPGTHGVDLIARIKIDNPALRVPVITMHAEESFAARASRAGASG